MNHELEDIAKDFLHIRDHEVSQLCPEDFSVEPLHKIRPYVHSRKRLHSLSLRTYLVQQLAEHAPSFPSAIKKLLKAAPHNHRYSGLLSTVYSSLFIAVFADKENSIKYLTYLQQVMKVNPQGLSSAAAHFVEDSLHSEMMPYLFSACRQIPEGQKPLAEMAVLLLFGQNLCFPKYWQASGSNNVEDYIKAFIEPLFNSENTKIKSEVMSLLRMYKKHSRAASSAITQLAAAYAGSTQANFSDDQNAISTLKQFFDSDEALESLIQNQLNSLLTLVVKGGDGYEDAMILFEKNMKIISAFANQKMIENVFVKTVFLKKGNYLESLAIKERLENSITRIAKVLVDPMAFWWSILNKKESVNDYYNLKKSRNAVLRSAADAIFRDGRSINDEFAKCLAKAAIKANYTEKSLNMLVHSMPDGQQVMRGIYGLISDETIIERLDNSSKRAVLTEDLGL